MKPEERQDRERNRVAQGQMSPAPLITVLSHPKENSRIQNSLKEVRRHVCDAHCLPSSLTSVLNTFCAIQIL